MSEPYTEVKLWVYGSLLEGFYNYQKALVDEIEERISAYVVAHLYHQPEKGYPALLPGTDRVYGELLTIRNFRNNIDKLDMIEEYFGQGQENEYNRIMTSVTLLTNGETEQAYVYWYGRDDINTPQNPGIYIPSGDWRSYMKSLMTDGSCRCSN